MTRLTYQLASIIEVVLEVNERDARSNSQSVRGGIQDVLGKAGEINVDGILHRSKPSFGTMRTASGEERNFILVRRRHLGSIIQ